MASSTLPPPLPRVGLRDQSMNLRQFLSGPVVKLPYSEINQMRGMLDLRDPTLLHPSLSFQMGVSMR